MEILNISGDLPKTGPLEPKTRLERGWRINKEHLYYKILRAWLPDYLKAYGEKTILETTNILRRISWEVIKILKKEAGKEVSLPLIIVTPNPSDILIFSLANEENWEPEILCDEEKTIEKLGLGYAPILMAHLHQVVTILVGAGPLTAGSASKIGFGIYDARVENLFKENLSSKSKQDLLQVVIEETLHYFCYNTNFLNSQQMEKELTILRKRDDLEYDIVERFCHQVEKKYGIKNKVNEILKKMRAEGTLENIFLPIEQFKKAQ